MTDSIVSRDSIRLKARAAYFDGRDRDSHGMNPGSHALHDWLIEYDRCASSLARKIIERSFPLMHGDATTCHRVEQEQERV